MKFAFSTDTGWAWDSATVAGKAREWGYDGVELATPRSIDGTEVCGVAASVGFVGAKRADAQAALDVRRMIDAAQAGRAANVILPAAQSKSSADPGAALVSLGDWLKPLGEYAAEKRVGLLVSNGGSFRTARQLWTLLDRLDLSKLGCCWNAQEAMATGETSAVAVPTLNSRIRLVQVSDKMSDSAIRYLVERLRGIGFGGYLSVHCRNANAALVENVLRERVAKLRAWNRPPEHLGKKHRQEKTPAVKAGA